MIAVATGTDKKLAGKMPHFGAFTAILLRGYGNPSAPSMPAVLPVISPMALTTPVPLRHLCLQPRTDWVNLKPEFLLWPRTHRTETRTMLARQESVFVNPPDRRAMRRFSMRLPASVRVPGIPSEFLTQTENVCARGIFFYIDRIMTEGSRLEVTMEFPAQVTMADPLRVRCVARVLRIAPQTALVTGVAAAIEEYEFVR